MFDSALHEDDAELLARLDAVLDELTTRDLTRRRSSPSGAIWRPAATGSPSWITR
jgi:hypothetical protein